ncbi:cysteine protease ATG4-like isoform X2 [Mangifera indica]|uniref:cysteine protease ATG4-like isoform X2 n=1 Tax=Mangifera indica TaxID=29780 RepID=UPI001CFB9FCF|nr:cysteine protease ATG4-like isoform X2 [Mangifera indica]XP_044466348.1 cysteine protease ATG4-like isoform X2 [Mangifera indica]
MTSSEPGSGDVKKSEGSLLSGFLTSAFSIFETYSESSAPEKKAGHSKSNGWAASLKRVVTAGSMRRILDRVLGPSRTGIISSTSDIWLLGVCYKISQEESTSDVADSNGLVAFNQDFSSRILITYRKGFDTIGDSKFTSDVGWGCMLRSSQMLIAQALLFHRLGRSWRKSSQKPFDLKYLEILHLFGDAEASPFSIHNLLQAGKAYGLAAGSWVSPYAMCRTWESLARCKRKEISLNCQPLPMAVYVVSGDEEGEQGGAPVVCIEDVSKHCFEISKGDADWMPILLLVPLVLGLEKVNPRFIPSLRVTFSFPQSLGIMGGKPGASTYIVGVQEDCAFYLDPHDVQPVVIVNRDDLEVDTSSYHCDVVRHIQLNSIDPSLAIGFYCQDKDDFDDFCSRASKLADESDGAPLFTVTQTHKKPVNHGDVLDDTSGVREDDSLGVVPINDSEGNTHEDDWLLL